MKLLSFQSNRYIVTDVINSDPRYSARDILIGCRVITNKRFKVGEKILDSVIPILQNNYMTLNVLNSFPYIYGIKYATSIYVDRPTFGSFFGLE